MKKLLGFVLLAFQLGYAGPAEIVFTDIWKTNYWGGVSLSGTGSDLIQTKNVRERLPEILKKYSCKTLLDAPCGDYYWLKTVDLSLEKYTGIDVVLPLIITNQIQFGDKQHLFIHMDIINEVPPKSDLILCRDCLVHFSHVDIAKAIKMFKLSGSIYLLATSFTENHPGLNSSIQTGEWRSLDLRKTPYNFPEPLEIINENCTVSDNAWNDKCLFLWKIADLPDLPLN